ncbi:MAG: type II toxin-antitoxin system HicB family antitoxin [Sumerlaeia bacterium]
MITQYLDAAMKSATYEILPDDRSYYGEIPDFPGVWANASTLEECRAELLEVLEGWLLVRLSRGMAIPEMNGIRLAVQEAN